MSIHEHDHVAAQVAMFIEHIAARTLIFAEYPIEHFTDGSPLYIARWAVHMPLNVLREADSGH